LLGARWRPLAALVPRSPARSTAAAVIFRGIASTMYFCEPRHPLLDLLRRQRRVTEYQPASRERGIVRVVGAAGRQRIDPHPQPARLGFHRRGIGRVGGQLPEHVETARLAAHLDQAEIAIQRGEQGIAPHTIFRPDAREVRGIAAAAHHLREHRLLEPGAAVVEQCLHGADGIGEMRRHHHVAEPHGAERLRERPEIDGAVRRERRDRRQRRALVAEVAIVVVFQDVAADPASPGDQRPAPCRGRVKPVGYWWDGVT
jgi:hypothetical protein